MYKNKKNKEKVVKNTSKPKLEDFYDIHDPRGCSTSEYNSYVKALQKWQNQ